MVTGVRDVSCRTASVQLDGAQDGIAAGQAAGVDPADSSSVSCSLPADLSAVREARLVVQHALDGWRADDIYDDVVLVASELVANALRHGLRLGHPRATPPTERPRRSPEGQRSGVRISLVTTGTHVICAVTDPSDVVPVCRPADPLAGSGRGLQMVDSLSACWGWTLLDGDTDPAAGSAPEAAAGPASGTTAGLPTGFADGLPHGGKSVWAIFPLSAAGRTRVVGAA